jgi:hypothetical protein
MKKSLLSAAIAAAVGLTWSFGAQAGAIGIDLTGTADYDYFNSLSMDRDSGVDLDLSADFNPTNFPANELHAFVAQALSSGGDDQNNAPQDFNNNEAGTLQFTKITYIQDRVDQFVPVGTGGGGLLIFKDGPQVVQPFLGTNAGGSVQLAWYVDDTADGTGVVKDGAQGVDCYGAGCANGADDGVRILEAQLVKSTPTSFLSTQPGSGSGSFTLTYRITWWDPDYIDVSLLQAEGLLINDVWSGTLVQPNTTLFPYAMWDGTKSSFDPTCGTQLFNNQGCVAADGVTHSSFQVDSSESFFGETPEPGTLALLGIGLLGAAVRRGKKAS